MGVKANLVEEPKTILFGDDGIVIRKYGSGIIGGKTLDVSASCFAETTILKGGHVIIFETATGKYKPMPIDGNSYTSLPAGHEYVGVLVSSVTTKEPFAAIMYDGEVNDKAVPYSVDSIKAALKTALPKLVFMHD